MKFEKASRPVRSVVLVLSLVACSGGKNTNDGADGGATQPSTQSWRPQRVNNLTSKEANHPAASELPTPTPLRQPEETPAPKAPSVASSAEASPMPEMIEKSPPVAFAQCAMCHVTNKGAPSTIGPNLYGIMGRPAGTLTGYQYSSALKNRDEIWNSTTMDAFIESPMTAAPGTKMAFVGVKDIEQRRKIIHYLSSLD